MFEQSQLELSNGKGPRRPVSVMAGFLLQGLCLAGLLMFSLFVTEAVPRARFATFLMEPPSASHRVIAVEQPRVMRPVQVNLVRRQSGFVAPSEIPDRVVILAEQQVAEPRYDDPVPPGFLTVEDGTESASQRFLLPTVAHQEAEPPPPLPETRPVEPVRVSSSVAAAKLLRRVQPIYPRLAIQARIQGTVNLEAVINENGDIINLRVTSGHPLLIQSAVDAVSQWQYQPTQLNGRPVAVITTVEVNFRLGGN